MQIFKQSDGGMPEPALMLRAWYGFCQVLKMACQFGGMDASMMARKELENENRGLNMYFNLVPARHKPGRV
ncbi:MAG: hypothetical protein ACYC0M_03160 [Burkholderiales bacterium]